MKIAIQFIKRKSGYPLNGGGFTALSFSKVDIDLLAKIINDLDLSSYDDYVQISCQSTNHNEIINLKEKDKFVKNIWKQLSKKEINKKMSHRHGFIDIMSEKTREV